ELVDKHKGIIYKISNSYCADSEDRKDVIQEIIIQLWSSYDSYDPKFKISTWIYRISLNTAISFYRKNKLRKAKTSPLSSTIVSSKEAEKEFCEDPNIVKLQEFIQELREIDKAIILLYLDGISQKEIAEIVGISQTNAGTKISRIKKILRDKFKNIQKL
ncbi:MAG: sigma-70 family RNA polymerase sigma factor, partial [Bacteroidia bacterium]|nr:sigma-70 family RNA polymerase sigma factor [Bacteroidia bacterium]